VQLHDGTPVQHSLQSPTSLQAQQQQQQAGALAAFGAPLQPDLAAAREIEALKDAFAGGPGHPRYRFVALLLNVVDNPASRVKMPGWSLLSALASCQLLVTGFQGVAGLHRYPLKLEMCDGPRSVSTRAALERSTVQPSRHLYQGDKTLAVSPPVASWSLMPDDMLLVLSRGG
jgi:hypothetical protein